MLTRYTHNTAFNAAGGIGNNIDFLKILIMWHLFDQAK